MSYGGDDDQLVLQFKACSTLHLNPMTAAKTPEFVPSPTSCSLQGIFEVSLSFAYTVYLFYNFSSISVFSILVLHVPLIEATLLTQMRGQGVLHHSP